LFAHAFPEAGGGTVTAKGAAVPPSGLATIHWSNPRAARRKPCAFTRIGMGGCPSAFPLPGGRSHPV